MWFYITRSLDSEIRVSIGGEEWREPLAADTVGVLERDKRDEEERRGENRTVCNVYDFALW